MTRSVARTARTAVVALLTGLAATLAVGPGAGRRPSSRRATSPATASTSAWPPPRAPWTPGCKSSPFLAVGIYISGDSRACRSQPNLTKTWVSTQLRNGWRLLPITLGPQASCSTRFPRYGNDETINPRPGADGKYGQRPRPGPGRGGQGGRRRQALGIAPRSTLWYDIEGVRPHPHPLPRVGPGIPQRLDVQAARARLRLRRLLQRRLGHQDPRRRPREPAATRSTCPT